ncbi:MAG: tol-pal system YbgF family protein, partial [Planctomycetota bacterium]
MIARNRRTELVRKLAMPALVLAIAVTGTKAQSGAPSSDRAKEGQASKAGSRSKKKANPTLKEARRALVNAGKLGRAPRGTKHPEKLRRLSEAAMAFRRVEQKYASLPEIVAEAVFRQGQLLGRMGRGDESVKLFRRVAAGSRFAVRALLEAGHVERRRKHYPDALAL